MPILTGIKFDRRRESQKTIVTIEFTTPALSGVRNFIKIEAFSVFHPKLWPNRWQVPTITGANMDRHQKVTKNDYHYWIYRPRPVQSTKFHQNWSICLLHPKLWSESWQVQTLAGVKSHRKRFHQWIQHFQIAH